MSTVDRAHVPLKEPGHKPDALITAFDSGVRNNAVEDLQSQAGLMGR